MLPIEFYFNIGKRKVSTTILEGKDQDNFLPVSIFLPCHQFCCLMWSSSLITNNRGRSLSNNRAGSLDKCAVAVVFTTRGIRCLDMQNVCLSVSEPSDITKHESIYIFYLQISYYHRVRKLLILSKLIITGLVVFFQSIVYKQNASASSVSEMSIFLLVYFYSPH